MNSPATYEREADLVRASLPAASAVSWSAILAGASVAAASSMVLLTLCLGFGLLTGAGWPYVSGARVAVEAAIALIVIQWVSAAVGGYITGRLRTRWAGLHTHEVFFRDTAHGFITWSVATVMAALFFASAAGAMHGNEYESETMNLTPQHRFEGAAERAPSGERNALVQTVDQGSGWRPLDRHQQALLQGSDPAVVAAPDVDRKSAAKGSIFVALSMLIGAFVASASAALGGRLRDQHP